MRFNPVASLRGKIAILIFVIIGCGFVLNLAFAIHTLRAEKINDLRKVLSHAMEETRDEYLPSNPDDKLDLSYLYEVPHNISILGDSEVDSLKISISKAPHVPLDNEIAEYIRLDNGNYLNFVSLDAKINASLIKYSEKLLLKYVVFLVVMLIVSILVLRKLMAPLKDIAAKCRDYKDGGAFLSGAESYPSEINSASNAFNALVGRLEGYRKKEKELFREAAHELKTPLAIMRARLDVYEGDETYQKGKFVAEFSSDLERLSSELKNVLFFETSDFEDNEEFNMCSLILETVGRIDVLASGRNINIEPKCETMFVDTKKKMFRKLFAALLENAVTYAKEGSKIEITLNQSERTLGIKNQKGGEKYMFSSKIGERILKRVSSELGFLYEISDADGYYEVNLRF